jgi:hypothetical protein
LEKKNQIMQKQVAIVLFVVALWAAYAQAQSPSASNSGSGGNGSLENIESIQPHLQAVTITATAITAAAIMAAAI